MSHSSPGKSTAFLIKKNQGAYLLYVGDTGADTIEHHNNLRKLWQQVAPLIQQQILSAIMIEISYPNQQSNQSLYGHLKPMLLNQEFAVLSTYTIKEKLRGVPVIVTHIKPEGHNEQTIKKELEKDNPFQVKWIIPQQGKKIML